MTEMTFSYHDLRQNYAVATTSNVLPAPSFVALSAEHACGPKGGAL